ncbi:MAG: hypothetical protein HYR72_02970 [Deltaproteobacteria bacterium]|nr:hypothetical protein [Deltaproteobacteria bacterium]MBI3388373.1 hypothetical protein [Deltaproteobacteria bacterium]
MSGLVGLIAVGLVTLASPAAIGAFTCDIVNNFSTGGAADICGGSCPEGQTCKLAELPCAGGLSGTDGAASGQCSADVTCECVDDLAPGIVNSLLRHQR